MNLLIDNRKELFNEKLNNELIKSFGTRINLSRVKSIGKNKFEVFFNYNKLFNIIDEQNKKVYIRNFYFKNIYSTEMDLNSNLNLPIREINRAIDDEFLELRDNLFQKVVSNKEIVIRILKNIHTTSAFLNKFYTILNDLVYDDVIEKQRINDYINSNPKYKKYIQLIIDTKLANFDLNGNLKASNKFKKILEQNQQMSNAIEECIFRLIETNYDYIVYEMGLRHIKAYINIVACMHYLEKIQNLEKVDILISNLHKLYINIFEKIDSGKFRERVNSLVISDVFKRTGNSIQLAIT